MGLEVLGEGVAVIQANVRERQPQINSLDFLVADDAQLAAIQLREFVAMQKLKGANCNLVLAREHYTVLLADKPNVPDDELREAMKFRLRDISPIPLEKAVVDVFDVPDDAGSLAAGKVFAVVADKKAIADMIDLAEQAGLRVDAVDIPELCLRNLLDHGNEGARTQVVVQFAGQQTHISVFRQGNLYLSRSCNLQVGSAGLTEELSDRLLLELQRSLDYVQHQMRQPPPSHIFFSGLGVQGQLPAYLVDGLPRGIESVPLSRLMAFPAGSDPQVQAKSLVAAGAALRDAGVVS